MISADSQVLRGVLPDGPKAHPMVQSMHYLMSPMSFYALNSMRYGEQFSTTMAVGGKFVITSDPDLVRELIVGDPDFFVTGKGRNVLRPLFGVHSLLLLDGTNHKRHRKLIMPPLHGERMRAYGATMTAVADRAIDSLPQGRPVRMLNVAQKMTFEIIMETVFGATPASHPELTTTIEFILQMIENPFLLSTIDEEGTIQPRLIDRVVGNLSPVNKFLQARAKLRDLLHVEWMKRCSSDDNGDDLFSMFVEARDEDGEPLSFSEIHDELVTMLLAGHDTTATALSNTLMWITRNPEVYDKIAAEVETVGGGAAIDPDNVVELKYTMAVVKESLRRSPVVPSVSRLLEGDWSFKGYDYPAGTDLSPNMYLLHHRADIWPEPYKFRPERFLEKSPKPWEFMPFGMGNRTCVGMAFAYYELRILVAEFVRRTNFKLMPGYIPMTRARMIVAIPTAGMPMIFRNK